MMKTIAILLLAVTVFAGCSAKQENMMSDVESSVSSVLEPDKSSSEEVSHSSTVLPSESGTVSEYDPAIESDDSRIVR